MPAASISARPMTSSVSVSCLPAISRARSASAVGVRSLAGRFWRSRVRLTDSPTTRPVSTGPATSWWAETISSATPVAVVVVVVA